MKQFLLKILRKPAALWEKHREKNYLRRGRFWARYYRLLFAECGTHLQMNGKPVIWSPEKIHIGNHVTINQGAQICPRGEVYIGDYVTMSRGSQITAGGLDTNDWTDERFKERRHIQAPVYIGEGTWLCVNSVVLSGVSITGKGVIVAAGAVVTKDITEDYVVVGGVPAKIVKRLKNPSE